MQKENIKAILFDLDGTLFRSERYHLMAWNEALKKFDITVDPEIYHIYIGKSAKWIEADIKNRYNKNFADGELIKEKDKIFQELFKQKGWSAEGLMPFARESVEFFNNNSYLLSICTNGSREETLLKLRNSGIEKYFDAVFTTDDVASAKPAPDVYLAAIKKFGLNGNQCLAIDDTQSGILSAKSAGAYCFAVPNEYSGQDFKEADQILNSLEDLINFFKK
ncbi:MAG: HAD family phosphatase [Candidatus Paceibacterota bacterium]